MSDDRWLGTSLTALGVVGASEVPFDDALVQVATLATWAVEDAEGAAITWLEPEGPPVKAASHSFAGYLDEEQFDSDEGPSPRALEEQRVVTGHITSEISWMEHSRRRGEAEPHRTVLAAPLSPDGRRLGLLSLYSAPERTFDSSAVAGASKFAEHAGLTLRAVRLHDSIRSRVTMLEEALSARLVIDRAKGILMVGRRCGSEEALGQLRKVSVSTNVSLYELATRLVASVDDRAESSARSVRRPS